MSEQTKKEILQSEAGKVDPPHLYHCVVRLDGPELRRWARHELRLGEEQLPLLEVDVGEEQLPLHEVEALGRAQHGGAPQHVHDLNRAPPVPRCGDLSPRGTYLRPQGLAPGADPPMAMRLTLLSHAAACSES